MKIAISTRPNRAYTSSRVAHGKDEHGLHVEQHEQHCEHVVADLALSPVAADRIGRRSRMQ